MAVSFDKVAGIYDATRWSGFPPEIMKKLLDTMKETFASCRTILDVGTGTGRFAQYLTDSGFNVLGIDVSLAMMAKAREKRLRNLVQADAHHLPFEDKAFDGAVMIHVLHLVRDWVQVVGEIGRVTRKVIVAEVEGGGGFSPRSRYLELRKEMGYPLERFNDGEAGLRGMVHPAIVKLVGSSGVVMGPLRQASVFMIISTVFGGRLVPHLEMTSNPASPSSISSLTSVTFCTAFKTVRVASTTSGPIPSPGNTAIL